MPKKTAPLQQLESYLPPHTFRTVLNFLQQYQIHLTISKERKSILGDYRHQTHGHNHRISVNGNLNPFSFLITLLHEIAHLLTFENHGRKVLAHGAEWKKSYSELLKYFLEKKIFPADVESELKKSMNKPAASSCAVDGLIRILRKYDKNRNGFKLIEEIPSETKFRLEDGRVFIRGEKLRKRYKCVEVGSKKIYLFNPVYEVEAIQS